MAGCEMRHLRGLHIFLFNLILIPTLSFPQGVTKVLISGLGGQHDTDVQTAFELGYASYDGSNFSGTITKYFDIGITNSLDYAKNNGYEVVVRSTTGLVTALAYAPSYPEVQVFMPAGSNSYEYVFSGDIESCPIVVTGAGDSHNETGYKVEFFAPDPITIEPDRSSFPNGYIAGQISFIANSMNKTIQEARISARETLKGGENPDMYDGYGKVVVQDVLDQALPVELVSFSAELTNEGVLLNWETATEVNNYGFNVEKKQAEGDWLNISFVQGHGNTSSPKSYKFLDTNPPPGKLQYRLKQIDTDGSFAYYETITEVSNTITTVEEKQFPTEFSLSQNYPNPFNPVTTIKFSVPASSSNRNTTLKIYDLLGTEIAVLVNEKKAQGEYEVQFDAGSFASGVYFYQLVNGNHISTKKLTVTK